MKRVERILIKLVFIHFLFLLAVQFFIHKLEVLPEVNKIVFYEGVEKMKYSEIIETLSGKVDD
ncbi:YpfB family protein [Bacillus seohaeanensis]|jgi:Family of unknown function (DUF5359)|uniref:YpfB family protein n=1 Tax=Bacillus seohaeanensis TaxID=284580 RepID=A0ABW5RLZ5_9BACI